MESTRIQTGATERIVALALDASLATLTGLTDLVVMAQRVSDGYWFDFTDLTFKSSGWTTRQQPMTEISASLCPGQYRYDLDTGTIANPNANDTYLVTVIQTPGTTVKNMPQVGELKVGQYVDRLDVTVGTRAAPGDAMDLVTDAVDGYALAASAIAEIQSGLATAAALAAVQADTDDIQSRLPAALVGGRMDSSVGAMAAGVVTATAVATDAIDADAIAADAVAEIQAGLATAAALVAVQADTDDIQSRLPAALVGGRMDSSVGAMAANVVTSAAVATDAIDADALAADAIAEIQSGLATAAALAAVQADTDDIQSRLPASLVGGRMRAHVEAMDADTIGASQIAAGAIGTSEAPLLANLDVAVSTRAIPGDAMDLVTDAVDGYALAASAVAEIDAALSAAHGAGSWEGSSASVVADAVWDEAKAGHSVAGSFGEEVQSHATPSEVLAQVGAGLVAYDAATGADVATRAAPGDAMDLVAGAVDAAAIATDAIDADALAASAIAEIQSGLATAAALAAVQADTDDIQGRLPAALVGGRMDSSVGAMAADVIGSAQIAAGAIGTSEAPLLANLDAAVSSRAAPGAAMDLVADAVDASALAASAVSEIDTTLSAAHGAGSWEGSSAAAVADAVWDEAKAGHSVAGSFGEEVQSHATPSEVLAQVGAGLVAYDAATGADVATRAAPGDAMDLVAGAVDAAAIATDAIDADALAASAIAEIQSGLATAAALAAVQADTDDIQGRLPAALVGGRMDSSVGAMAAGVVTATAVATDAIDADAIAADAVAEIQSGLATAAALAAVQADTDDIQARLPASLVGGRMDSSVGAMAAGVVTAAAIATDAIDADAVAASAVAEIQSGLATAAALAAVQADTDDIQSRLPASLVGGRMRAHVEAMDADTIGASQIAAGAITPVEAPALANLDAAVSTRAIPGDAMDLVTDAVDGYAVAASAVAEIQSGLATAAAVAAVQADTDDIQSRLPTTLHNGLMRSHVESAAIQIIMASVATGAVMSVGSFRAGESVRISLATTLDGAIVAVSNPRVQRLVMPNGGNAPGYPAAMTEVETGVYRLDTPPLYQVGSYMAIIRAELDAQDLEYIEVFNVQQFGVPRIERGGD